jgi:hypothetical protein
MANINSEWPDGKKLRLSTLHLLRMFATAVRGGSFSKAAEILNRANIVAIKASGKAR